MPQKTAPNHPSEYDVSLYIDESGKIIEWTPYASKVFGIKSSDALKKSFTDLMIHANVQKSVLKEIALFLKERKGKMSSRIFPVNLVNKDKSKSSLQLTIVSWQKEGKPLSAVFINDNTEQSRIEEELRKSELRYRTLIDQASDPIMITDAKGTFLDVNSRTCTMFGYKREELINKNVALLIDAEQLKQTPIQFDKIMRGVTVNSERRMVHRDGTIIEVEANVKLFPDDSIVAIARDVTERRKMEQSLRESEFMFRKVTENEILGIAWANSNGEVLNANATFCKMLGFTLDELMGKHFGSFTHPEDLQKELKYFEKISEGKLEYYQIEKRFKTKSGEFNWVELNLSCYRKSKEKTVEFYIGIVQNINERKKAEEEISKSHEQLRQLSSHLQKIREEERSNIAREIHDVLGHQLTSIKMDAVLLGKRIIKENKLAHEKISSIKALVDETVKSVRHISSQLRPGILDDLGLIDALEWQSNDFQNRTGIKAIFDSEVGEQEFEKGMATGIFRVHQETLTNIARHAHATQIRTTLSYSNDMIVLRVKDNGVGFDESILKDKRSLGLVGMKERASAFGGKFRIESVVKQGTVVTLEIPALRTEKKSEISLRILIADDHNIVRMGLKDFLLEEFPDAEVTEVSDGNELLRIARKSEFDIIISDLSMPGKHGLESLKQLREEFPKLPVLILSMHPEDQYAIRSLRAGAAGYLTKESAPEELANAVKRILSGKKYITPGVAARLAEFVEAGITDESHASLSDREFSVLKKIASGRTVGQIASELSVSVTTVSTYRARILQKMKLSNNAELTHYAVSKQLV